MEIHRFAIYMESEFIQLLLNPINQIILEIVSP
jgi:hypothetical protein